MLEKFQEISDNRHQYAQDWKARTGKKVFGYMCTYAPEELIYAAGVLPVRVLGSHEPQDVSERHIYAMYCPFCRDVLAQGLQGRYKYLDGMVMGHSCMHIKQAFDSWVTHVPIDYSYYMFIPQIVTHPKAKEYLTHEMTKFKENLEKGLGVKITAKALDNAIDVYNTNRRLLREIYELRKQDPPPVSGSECQDMVVAGQLMDKAEHNKMLAEALKEIKSRAPRKPGKRLMLIGGECDDTGVAEQVEKLGANIVADDLCAGSRYFWNEVVPEKDRLAAIAARYLDRPACPLKDVTSHRYRLDHILKMAQDFKVEGALLVMQKFCDPHEFDIPVISKFLKEHNIPSYFIELDVTFPEGPLRTRTEAFLEMLELETV
ncbi:MAG: 2-hydroxyacyl-CoA dehydratase [Chloroflexi bacterium]|nr:2-hydroxyacyl-CoA dehydratase [Chloroflexota bacterium]